MKSPFGKVCCAIKFETKLTSVLELRKEIEERCHRGLRECFAQHVFVGCASDNRALVQYGTKLFLCDNDKILSELFYQFVLYRFQNFDSYKFSKGIKIAELVAIALDLPETGWTEEDGDKAELAGRAARRFEGRARAMLLDYFSMEIDDEGELCSIPVLLENHLPDPKALPSYVLRLATEVEWESEKEFFETFARETGRFYARASGGPAWRAALERVLYPAVKEFLIPPRRFMGDNALLEVANLPDLYKVFERC